MRNSGLSQLPAMNRIRAAQRVLLFFCLFAFTAQCGKKNQTLGISVLPATPIVFDSDLTINAGTDNESTISRAWTKFKIRVSNSSATEDLTIVSFKFEVTARSESGNELTASTDFDPLEVEGNTTQSYWVTLAPGEEQTVELLGVDTFYVGELPNGDEVTNFRFSAKLTASGWIGDPDNPTKSLRVSQTFRTQ
ncbi:MAG: hypothetical protein NDI61_07230 [Bdellovibrionaceae bacterium]|nr:hypothetical protein [Pseudobdellovibrionaceae bacterium]